MSHIRNVPSPWDNFIDLVDVDEPNYTGHGGQFVRVNSDPNGLEFTDDVLQKSGGTMSGTLVLDADPTQNLHAATKQYVDATAQGLDFKESVRAASVGANLSLTGEQTIDGVGVVSGDRVLVMDQDDAEDNGIYVASGSGWSRSADADSNAEVNSGMFVFVEEGTANDNTGWVLSTDEPITLGTTELAFIQFSGAGTYTAGLGLTLTGSSFAVDYKDTDGDIQPIGTQEAGVANFAARSDHVHAHGDQAGGSLHADVIASGADGFMTGSDKDKLDNIAATAEVNQFAFSNIDVDAATAVLAAEAKTDTLYVTGGTLITLDGTVGSDTLDIAVTGGTDTQVLLTAGTTPTWSTHSFLAMADTPSSWNDNYRVKVNGTALEFVNDTLVNLEDVGAFNAGAIAVVNAGGTALGFTAASPTQGDVVFFNGSAWTYLSATTAAYVLTSNGVGANPSWQTNPAGVTTWVALSDVDEPNYTGHAGELVRVNSAPDGLEFVDMTGAPSTATTGHTLYWNGSAWTASGIIYNDHANAEVGINTATPNATLHVDGSISAKVHTITASYDMTSGTNADIHSLLSNNTSGSVTVALPTVASSDGRVYHIKKISAAANDVVIDGSDSETIDGALTYTLDIQYESVTLVCNGAAWFIV